MSVDMQREAYLRYWTARLDRVSAVINQVLDNKRCCTDAQYEELCRTENWCEDNIERLENELAELEEYRTEDWA